MEETKRVYLKDALPRLYADVEAWLEQEGRQEHTPQLAAMFITDRCTCGGEQCIKFFVESGDPLYAPLGGREPFYKDVSTSKAHILVGYANRATVGIITDIECLSDYPDDYIHKQLEAHGFFRPPPNDESEIQLA